MCLFSFLIFFLVCLWSWAHNIRNNLWIDAKIQNQPIPSIQIALRNQLRNTMMMMIARAQSVHAPLWCLKHLDFWEFSHRIWNVLPCAMPSYGTHSDLTSQEKRQNWRYNHVTCLVYSANFNENQSEKKFLSIFNALTDWNHIFCLKYKSINVWLSATLYFFPRKTCIPQTIGHTFFVGFIFFHSSLRKMCNQYVNYAYLLFGFCFLRFFLWKWFSGD